MKKKHITRVEVTNTGAVVEQRPDGSKRPIQDESDWKRIESLTDNEIIQAAEEDPDAQPLTVRQLARGYRVPATVDVKKIRARRRMSQRAFAAVYGFSVDALQDWEQGRSQPNRTARILLTVIDREPEAVERALCPNKKSA